MKLSPEQELEHLQQQLESADRQHAIWRYLFTYRLRNPDFTGQTVSDSYQESLPK